MMGMLLWTGWNKNRKGVLLLPQQQQPVSGKEWINSLTSIELILLIHQGT